LGGAEPGLTAPVVDGDEAVVDADCAISEVVEEDYSSLAFLSSTSFLAGWLRHSTYRVDPSDKETR
jgi:hypothetical protein